MANPSSRSSAPRWLFGNIKWQLNPRQLNISAPSPIDQVAAEGPGASVCGVYANEEGIWQRDP
ncbi:hypothetical protein HPB52_022701 [Rhipicephalus sanguineus]|uniref:Uncharacterized protein n=1 Tax=Rhipicephalus sanguineus TaxID=34632 RepID=A0A9D4SV79_RHISA|nr:hypothetical protein HPB52_022701 [Rhipicephalus sanguineus]